MRTARVGVSRVVGLFCLAAACGPAEDPTTLATRPTSEPVGPDVSGWTVEIDGRSCTHPPVKVECANGWCRLPSGCFIKGSPETELGHGVVAEVERPEDVKAIEVLATEVTEELWLSVFEHLPTPQDTELGRCEGRQCPVAGATWFEAAALANALSERHDPPLPACYELTDCQNTPGTGLVCMNAPPPLDECLGYRMPTFQEYEYAVRAGTCTAFYSGDISTDEEIQAATKPEPALELAAWYRFNSGRRAHPVAQKHPNRWGLFDMHGNLEEWLGNATERITQNGLILDITTRLIKGGDARFSPVYHRSANAAHYRSGVSSAALGFRLVRTL